MEALLSCFADLEGGVAGVLDPEVRSRRSATSGTAGIDFGLALLAQLRGEQAARLTQLTMEYDPKPPFDASSPEGAGPLAVVPARLSPLAGE